MTKVWLNGNPSLVENGVIFVSRKQSTPELVPTQIFPSRSSKMHSTESLESPLLRWNLSNWSFGRAELVALKSRRLGFFSRRIPSPLVVIQAAPSRSNKKNWEPNSISGPERDTLV